MKNKHKVGQYILWLSLVGLTSCEKQTLPERCNKATIIAESCGYIARIEGVSIGETWHGMENCVTISNLPPEAKHVGSTVYFTSYAPGSGPYCTFDKSYDYPRTTIELLNYSTTKCSEP